MQYMLLIYTDAAAEAEFQAQPAETRYAPWIAYSKALRESGIMVGGNELAPPATATTLRLRDGRRQVQDGPVAATKEQLGGYYVIEAPDLDTALDWAARCPAAATGSIEVRPLGGM
jgi:hypothetical protein